MKTEKKNDYMSVSIHYNKIPCKILLLLLQGRRRQKRVVGDELKEVLTAVKTL